VLIGVLIGLPFSWVQAKFLSLSVPLVDANDLKILGAAIAAL
jgi:hypothetical protein